jgi:hypothetical protein
VLRDGEFHSLTREVSELQFGPPMAVYREVLGAQLTAKQRVLLELALGFFSWRTLTRDGGLKQSAAVTLMVEAIFSAG